MERTRSRAKAHQELMLDDQYFTYDRTTSYVLPVERETTIDEEHPWYAWQTLIKSPGHPLHGSVVDIGGDFTSVKTECRLLNTQAVELHGWPHQNAYLYNFYGPLIPSSVTLSQPVKKDVVIDGPLKIGSSVSAVEASSIPNDEMWVSAVQTDEELAVLGASLVGKLSPTAPHNNVYTSLGELRNDGLPSIPFLSFLKGGGIAKNAGGEYLNYQFGIAPTISDVKKIRETIKEADKLWRQYARDSGRLVRRRFDMDPTVKTTTEVIDQPSWAIPHGTSSTHWSSVGPVSVTTTSTRKRGFSAAYLYYVDKESLNGMEGFLEKSQYLYGWKPSPSGVYNLTAWSWLLDWFTNTGDVIDNISLYLEDPFLVRWAYVTEHTVVHRQLTQTCIDNTGRSHFLAFQFKLDIKKRRRVNPLHLGFKGEALNGHQLAILAALGATRFSNPGSM